MYKLTSFVNSVNVESLDFGPLVVQKKKKKKPFEDVTFGLRKNGHFLYFTDEMINQLITETICGLIDYVNNPWLQSQSHCAFFLFSAY